MTRRHACHIVGVGQRLAGDDGVGLAVIDHLRRSALPPEITIGEVREPSALIPMLGDTQGRLVIVDAVLAEPAGEVLDLDAERAGGAGPGVGLQPRALGGAGAGARARHDVGGGLRSRCARRGGHHRPPDSRDARAVAGRGRVRAPGGASGPGAGHAEEDLNMHESSLAKQIVEMALARASAEGARVVRRVDGWVAETEKLSTDSLRTALRTARPGDRRGGGGVESPAGPRRGAVRRVRPGLSARPPSARLPALRARRRQAARTDRRRDRESGSGVDAGRPGARGDSRERPRAGGRLPALRARRGGRARARRGG